MDQVNNAITVYSIFDKPGDYCNIKEKEYETVIENNHKYDSPIEIIIPTYKRPTLLLEALNSAINQDVNFDYLITIIDNDPDSLNDKLLNKIEYRDKIRYIRNKENLGLFGNWNRAIQLSRAPFIALLHDDDMLESNYLSSLIKVIDKYPEVGVVTHIPYQIKNGDVIDPFLSIKSRFKKKTLQFISWKDYLYGNITSASCMLINKDKAIKINGWSSQEFPSADWFFNARMAFNHTVIIYHLPISKYRWDINTSLLPEMEQKFLNADVNFILNNLIAKSELINKFMRLRIRIKVNRILSSSLKSKKTNEFHYQQRVLLLLDELDKENFLTLSFSFFFIIFDIFERRLLWLFNHRRI